MIKIKALIKIIRPINVLITFATILLAAFISQHSLNFTPAILFAGFSGALIAAGGNVINDYFDVEIDRVNKPERILPANLLSVKSALFYYFILNAVGITFAFLTNKNALLIAIIAIVLLWLYSYRLKSVPLVGNTIIAGLTGLAFIYGGVAVNLLTFSFYPAVFAFLINLAREILKDIEDIKGDQLNNVRTIATEWGTPKARKIITFTTLTLIVLTTIPYFNGFYGIEYFLLVMLLVNVSLVYFLKELNLNFKKENLNKLSSILKMDMALGLIAIWLGS